MTYKFEEIDIEPKELEDPYITKLRNDVIRKEQNRFENKKSNNNNLYRDDNNINTTKNKKFDYSVKKKKTSNFEFQENIPNVKIKDTAVETIQFNNNDLNKPNIISQPQIIKSNFIQGQNLKPIKTVVEEAKPFGSNFE